MSWIPDADRERLPITDGRSRHLETYGMFGAQRRQQGGANESADQHCDDDQRGDPRRQVASGTLLSSRGKVHSWHAWERPATC